ncbi:MAG TPA: hypothetical protein VFM46_01285, partial [Pseudomonadales bacterium]|nr:hypothetical protein [Pseudomonadales bacterium]
GMKIIVQAPKAWHRYLCAIPGISQCVESTNEQAANWYFPMGSLPQVFALNADEVMGVEQYVFPSDELLISWVKTFSNENDKLKIGICWRDDSQKIACPLDLFSKITSIPDSCLVSLLREPTAAETAWLDRHGVKQPLNNSHDWLDVATCAKTLDLVICVESDCLTALAGLGVPTWAWHQPMPEWMWCLGGKSNAWYPRVRSVRQTRINEWTPLLDASYRTLMQAIHETGLS